MKLAELKRARADKLAQIQVLANQEAELSAEEELSAEQIAEFEQLEASIDGLDKKIVRQERAQQASAAGAAPVYAGVYAHVAPKKELEPGEKFAMYAMCVAGGGGDIKRSAQIAENQFNNAEMAAAIDTQTPDSAGVLVHEDYSADMIELLKPRTVIRRLGARSIPMPAGNLTMGRKTGRGSATYGVEGSDIKTTKPTFGEMKFSAKKLTGLTPISNDLIRQASRGSTQLVRDDLIDTVVLAEDTAFLRSDGGGDSPTGLRHQTNALNIIPATAGDVAVINPNLQAVDLFLSSLIKKQRLADVPMLKNAWIMSPSVFTYLEALRDGNGNKAYPEMANGRLKGYPVDFTNQLPENLGSGGNESEIYFNDFSQTFIADTMQYRIAVSTEATYMDNDELVSAFSRDQTVIRIIAEHDFGLRHDRACSIATNVKWGIQ
ncbi:phage major capsid protein [Shewanella surugensis]|uniref:Phage major capsid protein n=1 Tax=Shewanella surugensis TaxID=212020 RepID=A0ABT0LH91_9GAMM|nr:phage major capsid protein [Shewanella surugensis]MCL1126715.1 phage major capsid protein [Shewanella surugensis]